MTLNCFTSATITIILLFYLFFALLNINILYIIAFVITLIKLEFNQTHH